MGMFVVLTRVEIATAALDKTSPMHILVFVEDDWVYDRYFETPEQVEEYAEAVLPPLARGAIRSEPPALLAVLG